MSGMLVTHVNPCACSAGLVQTGFIIIFCFSFRESPLDDVLMRVDGKVVAGDGTVELRSKGERVFFDVLVAEKFKGDTMELALLRFYLFFAFFGIFIFFRDGKEMSVTVTLFPVKPLCVDTK